MKTILTLAAALTFSGTAMAQLMPSPQQRAQQRMDQIYNQSQQRQQTQQYRQYQQDQRNFPYGGLNAPPAGTAYPGN